MHISNVTIIILAYFTLSISLFLNYFGNLKKKLYLIETRLLILLIGIKYMMKFIIGDIIHFF